VSGLVVSIGVPILLAYVYGVVPISLCRSEGCGLSSSGNGGVKIDVEEDVPPYNRPVGKSSMDHLIISMRMILVIISMRMY
jgi:hypothetical protein